MQSKAQLTDVLGGTGERGRRFQVVLALIPALGGCLHQETSNPALDIPASYRAAQGRPHAAVPKLDWWRSFRSREPVHPL